MHLNNIIPSKKISRRRMCEYSIYSCGSLLLPGGIMKNSVSALQRRSIPSSGEKIPVVGVGTWRTFDAGNDKPKREILKRIEPSSEYPAHQPIQAGVYRLPVEKVRLPGKDG